MGWAVGCTRQSRDGPWLDGLATEDPEVAATFVDRAAVGDATKCD